MSHKDFLQNFVANLLSNAFPNLQGPQIASFISNLFDSTEDLPKFKLRRPHLNIDALLTWPCTKTLTSVSSIFLKRPPSSLALLGCESSRPHCSRSTCSCTI